MRDESTSSDRLRAAGAQAAEPAVGDEHEAARRNAGESRFRRDRQATHAHELEVQERSSAHGNTARVRRASIVMLYAVLAVLVGLLADWLENLPTVVTVIIAATVFGTLVVNDATARRP